MQHKVNRLRIAYIVDALAVAHEVHIEIEDAKRDGVTTNHRVLDLCKIEIAAQLKEIQS